MPPEPGPQVRLPGVLPGVLVAVDLQAPRPGLVEEPHGLARLPPVLREHRLVVAVAAPDVSLLADLYELLAGLYEAVALAAHVRYVHTAVLRHDPGELDHLFCERVPLLAVAEPSAEPEGPLAHRLVEVRFHLPHLGLRRLVALAPLSLHAHHAPP